MKLNCPHCASSQVRPEPYRWYEGIMALFFLRPFRCRRCRSRFMRFAGVPKIPGMLVLR